MSDAQKVTVGKPKVGGAIFKAPLGVKLPENAIDDLSGEFVSLGYASDSGLVNSNSPESTNIKAWGGDTVLTTQTDKKDTFKFQLIEALNINALKAVYGEDNVSGTLETGITIKANSKEHESFVWVFDMILKGNILKRVVLPSASVSSVGDVTYADETQIGYDTTITAVPDVAGNTHYEYIQKAKTESGGDES